MTSDQDPSGPKKGRRLAPDELARDIANRLKVSGGSHVAERRFLPRFDLLNAGRLIMGLGALLLGALLIAGFTWLSGLNGYEAPGSVTGSSPVYACPGGPQLGEVFEGEAITVIGRSPDQTWLILRDARGPGNRVYVLESAIRVDGDQESAFVPRLPAGRRTANRGRTDHSSRREHHHGVHHPDHHNSWRDYDHRSLQPPVAAAAAASQLAEPGYDHDDHHPSRGHDHHPSRPDHDQSWDHHDHARRNHHIDVGVFDFHHGWDDDHHGASDDDHRASNDHHGASNDDHGASNDDHDGARNLDNALRADARWSRWRGFRQLVPYSLPSREIPADLVRAQTDT